MREAIADQRIGVFEPLLPNIECKRGLLLTKEIHDELDTDGWADPEMGHRFGALEADLLKFVENDIIPVGMAPYNKDKSAFLARIDPPEYGVWTIRSYAPNPSIRVFGGFAERDTFVAIMTKGREDLDGPHGTKWMAAREETLARWNSLLPEISLLKGDTVDVFLSQNFFLV